MKQKHARAHTYLICSLGRGFPGERGVNNAGPSPSVSPQSAKQSLNTQISARSTHQCCHSVAKLLILVVIRLWMGRFAIRPDMGALLDAWALKISPENACIDAKYSGKICLQGPTSTTRSEAG